MVIMSDAESAAWKICAIAFLLLIIFILVKHNPEPTNVDPQVIIDTVTITDTVYQTDTIYINRPLKADTVYITLNNNQNGDNL